jgi:thermostable 8-oxoguanine DNA glycosylase
MQKSGEQAMLNQFATGERPQLRPHDEILPGVIWGKAEWVLSPAYWSSLTSQPVIGGELFETPNSLLEEIAFCMLGGFGITAEVNCAAHARLQLAGVYEEVSSNYEADIVTLLSDPLRVGNRQIRYRFPKQRGRRLATALTRLKVETPPTSHAEELREYLMGFEGIGPKTASWITRNWLNTDKVAIIDIHVERAGRMVGLFNDDDVLPRDYFRMEEKFLAFAGAIGVRASVLDVAIWCTMRKLGKVMPV